MGKLPTYDVVVPTTGRDSLAAALSSAASQTHMPERVIVVLDSDSDEDLGRLREEYASDLIEIHRTLSPRQAGAARRLATELASADWIAYLDDDDEFLPTKAETQMAAVASQSRDLGVLSCRFRLIGLDGQDMATNCPNQLYDSKSDLPEYLFRRRKLGHDKNSLHTSTLAVRTDLAQRVAWTLGLTRHQDWDFLLRLAESKTEFFHCPEELVKVAYSSPGSISRTSDWEASLAWYESAEQYLGAGSTRADFLVGQVVRYALLAGDYRAARSTIFRAFKTGRPSLRAAGLAAFGSYSRIRNGRT